MEFNDFHFFMFQVSTQNGAFYRAALKERAEVCLRSFDTASTVSTFKSFTPVREGGEGRLYSRHPLSGPLGPDQPGAILRPLHSSLFLFSPSPLLLVFIHSFFRAANSNKGLISLMDVSGIRQRTTAEYL